MEILEAVRAAIKELVIPELDNLKAQLVEVRVRLEGHTEAIRTLNAHLIDQSRRIDVLGERIDTLSERIDGVRAELSQRIEATHQRIDGVIQRLDGTNQRIDRLYEVIVRRDEHEQLARRVAILEQDVSRIKERLGGG